MADLPILIWLSGAAALAAAAWRYLVIAWSWIVGLLVVSADLEGEAAEAMSIYCLDCMKPWRVGARAYNGAFMRVRTANRIQLVVWELLNRLGTVWWDDWKPLWMARRPEKRKDAADVLAIVPDQLQIATLRGLFDLEALLILAVQHYNTTYLGGSVGQSDSRFRRHRVRYVYGTLRYTHGITQQSGGPPEYVDKSPDPTTSLHVFRAARPLGITRDQVGSQQPVLELEQLALNAAAAKFVRDIARWKNSENWYRSARIPWKQGLLLYGPPGMGKTTFARALAERMDFPVTVYDLASLTNPELLRAWKSMLEDMPGIALFEDFERIFNGRRNIVGEVSFDCLLGCLSGIERADGLFVIMTANDISSLDPALCQISETGTLSRPGRINYAIEMTAPDQIGRFTIAGRILAHWPGTWDQIVQQGVGETGAQFEDRCTRLALDLYWKESEK